MAMGKPTNSMEPSASHTASLPQDEQVTSSGTVARPSATGAFAKPRVKVRWSQDLLCTDAIVNLDVDAMYDFLLSQTSTPPRVVCRIVGKSREDLPIKVKVVEETIYQRGASSQRSSTGMAPSSPLVDLVDLGASSSSGQLSSSFQSVSDHGDNTPLPSVPGKGETRVQRTHTMHMVTGFDFSIDLTQYLLQKPMLRTVGDDELAYRGRSLKELWLDHNDTGEQQTEVKGDQSMLRSSRALKAWLKDYIERPGPFKRFEWTKYVEGWDWDALKEAIRGTILRSGYPGNITITFNSTPHHVIIRPPGLWSTLGFNEFGAILLWCLLIMPYLLYCYQHGRWSVAGEVWNFRRGEEGMKEGTWFRMWESTIQRAVEKRMTIKEALKWPWTESPRSTLEGYGDE